MVLRGNEANHNSPSPLGARDRNSPLRPAMRCLRSHGSRCISVPWRGQLAFVPVPLRGSKTLGLSFSVAEGPEVWRKGMAKRPLATGTEARTGWKEGIVRYI